MINMSFVNSYFTDMCHELPSSVNTSIGRIVEFYCSCKSGHGIVWYIDDELVSQQHNVESQILSYQTTTRDGFFVSTLSMLASERNNNSRVECGVLEFGHGISRVNTPEAAVLKVQGEIWQNATKFNLSACTAQ